MAVKYNEKTGKWDASFSKRHPISKVPYRLAKNNCKTEKEAQKAYRELVLTLDSRFKQVVSPVWPTVVKEAMQFLVTEKEYTKNTMSCYESVLNKHTMPVWSELRADQIGTPQIRELVNSVGATVSPSHKKNLAKYLRAVFSYAVEHGYVTKNPVPQFHIRITQKHKQGLSESQIRLFLETAREMGVEWYPVWAMAVYTGMRNGELYALPKKNVNLENNTILVNVSWNKRDGFKETKTGDERVLAIAPSVLPLIRKLMHQDPESPFLLPRLETWARSDQARELRMFLSGMGLPPIRFHDLRATWASVLLNKGLAPIKVMAMAGWKDLKTMQHYVRMSSVEIKGATACLDLHSPDSYDGDDQL